MGTDLQTTTSRLWKLIEERTHAGTDTQTIDRRIWDLFGEEWAIVFTDLSGFSRQVAQFGTSISCRSSSRRSAFSFR